MSPLASVGWLLAAGGLASSAFHLGRPERAWRAFSQWRSSWLSREGVFSVLTFLPAAVFGIGWVFFGTTGGLVGFCKIFLLYFLSGSKLVFSTYVGFDRDKFMRAPQAQ